MYKGSFKRTNEGDYHCTRDEVQAMLRDQSKQTMDMKILNNLELSVLDKETIKSYRTWFNNEHEGNASTNVAFAVVLYTECDLGRAKEDNPDAEKYRARQNVVFEHGYLIGKLGRNKVCAFVKGNVETPGDISGVVYTTMDVNGAWKIQLANNMKDAGLNIDLNELCR